MAPGGRVVSSPSPLPGGGGGTESSSRSSCGCVSGIQPRPPAKLPGVWLKTWGPNAALRELQGFVGLGGQAWGPRPQELSAHRAARRLLRALVRGPVSLVVQGCCPGSGCCIRGRNRRLLLGLLFGTRKPLLHPWCQQIFFPPRLTGPVGLAVCPWHPRGWANLV